MVVDTFFFVRILYMFIILIFWYYDIPWWEALLNKRGVEFGWDGVAFENSSQLAWREGALFGSLFFALDQFGHSWDGPSLYKKLQYFRAGQTSAASTNLTKSQVVGLITSSPFLNVMSSCWKKNTGFSWMFETFLCFNVSNSLYNFTPWNSSNGFLAYKNHIHSPGVSWLGAVVVLSKDRDVFGKGGVLCFKFKTPASPTLWLGEDVSFLMMGGVHCSQAVC